MADPTDIYMSRGGAKGIKSRMAQYLAGGPSGISTRADVAEEVESPDVSRAAGTPPAPPPPVSPEVVGAPTASALELARAAAPMPGDDPEPDLTKPQKWQGKGGWNYEYKPGKGDTEPTLTVYSPKTGRELNLGPGSRYYQPIMDEYQAGEGIEAFSWDPKAGAALRQSRKPKDPIFRAAADAIQTHAEGDPEFLPAADEIRIDGQTVPTDRTALGEEVRQAQASAGTSAQLDEEHQRYLRPVPTDRTALGEEVRQAPASADTSAQLDEEHQRYLRDAELRRTRPRPQVKWESGEKPPEGWGEAGFPIDSAQEEPLPVVATLDEALAPISDPLVSRQLRALFSDYDFSRTPQEQRRGEMLAAAPRRETAPERMRRIQDLAARIPPEEARALEGYIQQAIIAPMTQAAEAEAAEERKDAATRDFIGNVPWGIRSDVQDVFRKATSGDLEDADLDKALVDLPAEQAQALLLILRDHYGVA